MEYLPKPLRKNSLSAVKPEKKKITMADLANLKNMMKRFERPGVVKPEAAPERRGSNAAERRGSMQSTSSSSIQSVHSEHSTANLDGLQASLDKQRTMRRSNSTRDITSVLARSSDPLGSNSMHGSTATKLGAMQRNQLGSNGSTSSGFLNRSNHRKDSGDTPETEGDALAANSSNGRLDYTSSALMGRRTTARSHSDDGPVVSSGARSVHSLFSSSALIRRKKSGDDSSVMSSATTGSGKRRTRRLSMGSKTAESPAPETSTSDSMRNHLRSNLSSTGTGQPSTNLAELRSGLGLPSPSEKAKAATAIEQAVAASDNGTSTTTWGGALADLRRSVVSQRALMSASAHGDYDGPKTIMRGMGRRSSIGGMALPPTTLVPQVKKRSSSSTRSRSRGRSQSVQRSSKSTDESKSSENKSSKKKSRDRSESVQRIGKSPAKPSERKGRDRTSKSSDVPPETKASERKGRGRSRSVHGSSKSSGKSSAVPPATKAPDKKARVRSKSTQQRRTSKPTKEQARQKKYDYNDFDTDEAAKHEAEAAEAAEKEAAEKEAAGSALGRRRERSHSMSHRMITPETKYEPEDAIKQAAESAIGRRHERSHSISHRQPSLHGLGDATSTPEAEIPSMAANTSIQTEKSKVDSKDVSTYGAAVDPGGFPAWAGNKDFSGAGETSAPADFGAPVPWDDDPWAEDGGNFNQKAQAVTTKVETTPTVPAIINFGNSNDLFDSEPMGIGSTSGHSRVGGSTGLGYASCHSVGGGSSGSSGRGRGMKKQLSQSKLSKHMDTSFGGKSSDAGSTSGCSRNSLQRVRRSNVVSAIGPSIGQTVLAVPATKRRPSMTGSGFGGFDNSDVKSVGFDDHMEGKAGLEDSPVTSLAPPFAIAFNGKKVSPQKLDADSSQVPAANTGQPVPLEAANKLDEIKKMSQRLSMADYGLDQAKGGSERPLKRNSGQGIARDGSDRPLQGDSGKGIAAEFQAAKKLNEMRKASNAPPPTTASLFAAKLQAARQADSTAAIISPSTSTGKTSVSSGSSPPTTASLFAAKLQAARQADSSALISSPSTSTGKTSVSSGSSPPTTASIFAAKLQAAQQADSTALISSPSTSTGKSSVSSGSSPQKVHRRRQSMEMTYSPRPDNTAKKMDGLKEIMKQHRRSSLV